MTEYSITLPKGNEVHKPTLYKHFSVQDDVKLALSAFDTDGKGGLSSDELYQAFDYFVNKEKEIAEKGTKKGDGIITVNDIEQILKTDTRFSAIREKLKDDNKAKTLLYNIVMTLSGIVTFNKSDERIREVYSNGFWVSFGHGEYSLDNMKNPSIVHTELEEKNINGAKVKVYTSRNGEDYVTTTDGRRYTKEYAAKYLEYKTEKTWFGWGEDKYYVAISDKPKRCGNFGLYHQYKIWDEYTNSFKNGERKHIFDGSERQNY